MSECSACGTQLAPHEIRCPTCGKVTAQYHRQRRCMHCGAPAAAQAKTCMMCQKPVDSLPLDRSIFSGSWIGIVIGVLIIVGLVVMFNRYQRESAEQAALAAANADTPTPTVTLTATPTATETPLPPTSTPTLTPIPTATPRIHIVESGQSMLLISQIYGVPLNVLFDFNRLTEEDILNVGEEIKIPPSRADSVPLPGNDGLPAQIVYVVQSGDTLLDIAIENGTTVNAIEVMNPQADLSVIFPGQELVVPLSTPTPTATPTPLPTATSTPGPEYPPPTLLLPADEQVITQNSLLLNWTSPRLLADDEFYVVRILWPNNVRTTHWLRSNSLRLQREERPANGNITWSVSIRRRTGTNPQGDPMGISLSPPGETRKFEWR